MSSIIIITNNTTEDVQIEDLASFEITASGVETLTNYFTQEEIANSQDLISYVSDETFSVNNGVEDLAPLAGVRHCLGGFEEVKLYDEYRDRSGKLRVHQTSRKLGLRIMWTGIGDDPSDPTSVGDGEKLTFNYNIGDTEPMVKYIDFNIVENETWLHEGYLTWHNAQMDTLSLQMVPRVTSVTPNASGNYDLYGGYLVVPAVPGEGSYDIVSDITTHSGGLVYMPNNDLNEPPTAFWNADWNSSTQQYENITAAPAGNGRYNMFAVEVIFAEFIRDIPLLSSGFIALNSSDTDQMGHGMRLKMIADTNLETADDHDWSVACIMSMHRESSV